MRRGIRNLSALLWFLPLTVLESACQDLPAHRFCGRPHEVESPGDHGPLGNLPRDDAGPAVARQSEQLRRPEVGSSLLPLILSNPGFASRVGGLPAVSESGGEVPPTCQRRFDERCDGRVARERPVAPRSFGRAGRREIRRPVSAPPNAARAGAPPFECLELEGPTPARVRRGHRPTARGAPSLARASVVDPASRSPSG